MERKRWRDLVGPGRSFHISRNLMNRRDPVPVHDHDFAEILWIAEGSGTHRVNAQRIRHAARLLEVSDRSVLDVALDSGFENAGHFHRLFKSTFGVTPLRYRKRHRRIL